MMEDITDSPIGNISEHKNNVLTETNDLSKTEADVIVEDNSKGVPVIQINGESIAEVAQDQEPPIILVQDWDASGRKLYLKACLTGTRKQF